MLTRRRCLHLIGAFGFCSLMPPLALAAMPGDKRLVVVILRGAWDGLDVVRPHGDPAYARLRPQIGPRDAETIDLDGFFGLHPTLSEVQPLFRDKELSFVHAVATPYRNRSHFEGQDILEQGTGEDRADNAGWLNRLLGVLGEAKPSYAMDIGVGDEMILRGPNRYSSWYPELSVDLKDESAQFLQAMYKGDPLLESSFAEIEQIAAGIGTSEGLDPGVSGRELAQLAGKFLNEEARIAAFSLTGWDTHVSQDRRMPRQLKMLSDVLLELKKTLGSNWQHTAVVMCSEFGRTARFNGSGGTDHGTGGLALLAGGLLANGRGGQVISNKWPGLAEERLYESRDLMPTDDVRRYPAWLIASLFGFKPSQVAATVFPGIDMGDNLKLI